MPLKVRESNTPNIAYPGQHFKIIIPKGSANHVIVPDTLRITFDLDLTSTGKARSVVNNVGRTLGEKKVLWLGSKEIDVINNSYIYDAYKDLYLSEKECEERLLQGIQSANEVKAHLGAKKSDGTALTLTTQENVIRKTYDKRFPIPLDCDFFKHTFYPYSFEEDLSIMVELNSVKEVILCMGDTDAIYKISDIILQYDAIFDDPYATSIREVYTRGMAIHYTKVTSIHYQALSKKDIVWKIDLNNLSIQSLQGLLLLFPDIHDDFVNKNKEFYNPSIKKILVTINGIPHQLYRDIYSELKKYFYKENSNVNNGKMAADPFGDLMCYVFSLEDAVTHISVTDPSGILTIEK